MIEDAGFTDHRRPAARLWRRLSAADPWLSEPPGRSVPDEPFRAGMTVVIQPNVVTRDGKAGVQTGEMVLITQDGIERMHAVPSGFATSRLSS